MRIVGIICEYNPFHNGHLRQLRLVRAMGEDCAVICLMSGNYVQRGEPALFSKRVRAEAAVRCGANLILELPLTVALSSAEGFAAGGVRILSALGCDYLCFGTESADFDALASSAQANLNPAFDRLLRVELETGCSYAAARQRVLERLGAGAGLRLPNDILAVEYWKALLRQNSPMRPLPILRPNTYHAETLNPEAPSATSLRRVLCGDRQCCSGIRNESDLYAADWRESVPETLRGLYERSAIHSLQAGERAVLAILRSLPDEAFAALPFGTEGLWSKLMKNCRACASVTEIIEATKTKRYARSRIQRMLLCAALGLSQAEMETPPSYARILAFDSKGRALLRQMKTRFSLVNAGERPTDVAYYALESRAAALYGLFAVEAPEPPDSEERLRVLFLRSNDQL